MLPLEKRMKIKETLSSCKARKQFEKLGYKQDFIIDMLGSGEYIVRYINKKEDVAILIGTESKELLIRKDSDRDSTQLYTNEVSALIMQLKEIDEMYLSEVAIYNV